MDAGTEAGDEMNKFTSEFLLYAFPTCAQVRLVFNIPNIHADS